MLKKLQIIGYLVLSSACIDAKTIIQNNYIVYSSKEMQKHKKKVGKQMQSNLANQQDTTYQMERALVTLECNDTDSIPKVAGAGKIFNDGAIPYQLMHNGIKVILNSYYDVQWLTDVIYGLRGHHEPQEERCFYEVLQYIPEGATMIELGSYWAYYSLWFASAIKNAKNYMIEPDPKRLEIGKKNFELNNKSGVFKRGFVGKIHDADPDIAGTESISIDDFIESQGIKHIHILHSDVQGAEFEMLQTAIKHLDIIDYFFISTHGTHIHQQCLHFFKSYGLSILAEHNYTQSFGSDGLIVAKRKGVPGPEHITIQKK